MKYISILLLVFLSCINDNANNNKLTTIDKKLLIGIWSEDRKTPSFSIEKDSILYIESISRYKYELKEDSIKILFDGYAYTSKVIVTKDILKLISLDQTTIFFRIKNKK